MSKSEVLYVKGMNISESEGDDDDQWDDKKLNDAYDKAVRIANVEVAKRVAMSTNTPSAHTSHDPMFYPKNEKSIIKSSSSKKKAPIQRVDELEIHEAPEDKRWKAGMPCRLVYLEDGLEYEAVFVKAVENNDCVVKYLGYDTQEIVAMNSLKASLGREARTRQIKEAMKEQAEESFGSLSPNLDTRECSDRVPSPDSGDRASQRKKKPSKKKKNQPRNLNMNGYELPEMPPIPPMPNLSSLRNHLGAAEMPMPPPPMAFPAIDRSDSEEQAISSMLLSWYMSGYYTGLYQGLRRSKEGRRN